MSGENRQTGATGELMAAEWAKANGFAILHRNWRWKRYEIDLVAQRNGILHFIEVKTRRSGSFGHPEESVDIKKLKHIFAAAEQYLEQYPGWKRVQYDVLSILLKKDGMPDYFFVEDVSL